LSRTLGDHGFKKGVEGETNPEKFMITACPDF